MIVSFSVSNYRSFSSEETISLVASNRLSGSHDDHAVPIPDSKEKVLRTAVLYGANGAGKSNLFRALRYVKSAAVKARRKDSGTARKRFRFAGPALAASRFDLQFVAADKLYRFFLSVDDERIAEELLFQVVGGRQKLVYERTTDEAGKVTVNAAGLKSASEKVAALATVGGPQNQTFLATVNVTLNTGDAGEELAQVLTWFKEGLNLVGPDESFGQLGHMLDQNPDFMAFASAFLKSASTGVDHLEVLKEEIATSDPRSQLGTSFPHLTDRNGRAVRLTLQGSELLIEREGQRVYQISVQAAHEHEPGNVVRMELTEESDGTQRLLDLVAALHRPGASGAVYIIDEIDRSLHPILVKEFLEFFLHAREGGPGQLIVTTHESNLLDQDLLRRDEIWFAEKDQGGATRLYSLMDFKVRNDLEIRKHYLQGRFGAVPFLGNLDSLLPKTDRAE